MSNTSQLPSAQDIIEKFGGIRPMAKKMNVAVTTVQGWKKRNAIPQARLADVKKIAQIHDIDLLGSKPSKKTEKPISPKTPSPKPANDAPTHSTHEIKYIEPRGLSGRTVFVALIAVIAFIAAGLMTMAPKIKVVSEQADRITQLERELKTVKKEQSVLTDVVPSDLKNKLKIIEKKAKSATAKAQAIADNTKDIKQIIASGSVEERIHLIEEQIGTYIDEKKSLNLVGVWQNLQALQGSKKGSKKLEGASGELLSWINRLQSDEVTVEEALPIIMEESPLISETLGQVDNQNLKAAAMLLAMSQMRNTLSRDNASFEQDLALLQKLVGNENPALNASIEKLAPHASNGVLTPEGLSTEFRKMAGDVVIASLSGEDVSVSEKAKSRFGEILIVKKDGEQITGTETQRAVADAQALIDDGNIQGTIQVLQNLDGDAAKAVAPFLKEANLSLLATQIQEMLGQNIQSKIQTSILTKPANLNALKSLDMKNLNVDNVIGEIKEAVPLGGRVYEDPESGFKIYKKGTLPQ